MAVLSAGPAARADSCTGVTERGARFATCFDVGNRLSVTAATTGFGGALALRHDITFDDDPDLVWKMEHAIAEASYTPFDHRFTGLLYRGRYLRHARDGHIVLPLGTPQKVFLPFDLGALVEVGQLDWRATGATGLGIVKTAALIDVSRARDHRSRLAFGPVGSWGVTLDRGQARVTEQVVAPFSALLAEAHLESADGLTFADLRGEAGMVWHTTGRWTFEQRAEASLERIVLAVDDRPVALFAAVRYDSELAEATAGVGVRIVLVDRTDPRVSLRPPGRVTAASDRPSPSE